MMLVRDIMQTHPVTAPAETRLFHLLRVLQQRGFRHVPIVDGSRLVGIVSDRDVKQAMASAALSVDGRERDRLLDGLTAGQIMTRRVVTIGPMFGVEDAARLMATRKFSALPVTEGDRLVGIVTETDVLHLFVRAMGALEPGRRDPAGARSEPGRGRTGDRGDRYPVLQRHDPRGSDRTAGSRAAPGDHRSASVAAGARGW